MSDRMWRALFPAAVAGFAAVTACAWAVMLGALHP